MQRIYGYYWGYSEWDQIVDLFSEETSFVEIESHGRFIGKEGVRRMFWMDKKDSDQPKERAPRKRPLGIAMVIMQLGGVVTIEPGEYHYDPMAMG